MKTQSKILASVLAGIATGIAVGVLASLTGKNKMQDQLSLAGGRNSLSATPDRVEDWSDVNDSLGG